MVLRQGYDDLGQSSHYRQIDKSPDAFRGILCMTLHKRVEQMADIVSVIADE
jgi:hypothetical protein